MWDHVDHQYPTTRASQAATLRSLSALTATFSKALVPFFGTQVFRISSGLMRSDIFAFLKTSPNTTANHRRIKNALVKSSNPYGTEAKDSIYHSEQQLNIDHVRTILRIDPRSTLHNCRSPGVSFWDTSPSLVDATPRKHTSANCVTTSAA